MGNKKAELSEIQKGIFFECQTGGRNIYNISAAIRVRDCLDKETLENASNMLLEEQPALRSRIELEGDKLLMIEEQSARVSVDYYDIANGDEQGRTVDEIVLNAMEYEFDLAKAPLCRITLIVNEKRESVIILNIHHLVGDGISIDLVISKLSANYSDLCNGEGKAEKANYGFFNFVEEENRKLKSGVYETQKQYWKEKVKDIKPLDFPRDFAGIDNYGIGKELRYEISEQLMAAIEKASQKEGVTPFIFCLSAFMVLMGKCCNEKKVTVSSPISYRPGAHYAETIGCFIYTLPLTCTLATDQAFGQVVASLYDEVISAYKNNGYPNNLIARECPSNTYTGMQSIFDISFVYNRFSPSEWNGVKSEEYDFPYITFPGNMMVLICKMADRNIIKIQYKPGLYARETIDLLGMRFIKLLECVTADMNPPLAAYDLFLENEKEDLLHTFNQSSYFEYRPSHIIDIFHERVRKYKHYPALFYDHASMTYEEVNEQANQLAHHILTYKSRENEVIGIQLRRSKEMVISILAVLKAGCAYVPIEPYYTEDRKRYIFTDAEISIFITSKDLEYNFCQDKYVIFAEDQKNYGGDKTNPDVLLDPYDLAYIEYTSGSTGEPKGVMIEQHSVVNIIMDLERRFPVEEGDRYLYKTPFSFDISGTELYGWFAGAGALCIMEHEGEKNPHLIMDYVEQYKITHINFVPTMFRLFLDILHQDKDVERLSSLKWIFVGGEAVTTDVVEKFLNLKFSAKLENVYGPTECTMWASNYSLGKYENVSNISIGRPLNEIRWYVIDENKRMQMTGVPGELCLSGAGLARGYLNKKELTEEKFCDNPFYDSDQDAPWYRKMYRTGDLVRWLANGTVEFMGRLDFQVKINGIRIELGEIETALGQFPGVVRPVVVAKQTENHLPILCAYYLAAEEIPPVRLREFLNSRVSAYMIPAFFVRLQELPLNSSGKVDTKVLILDQSYKLQATDQHEQPKSETEQLIAQVWRKVLDFDQFGIDDNFFDIGGNSMSAILLNDQLKKTFNIDLSITLLFQYPTIRLLADYMTRQDKITIEDRNQYFKKNKHIRNSDIAIIGMAIDVPGADTISDFWQNLKKEKESIHFFEDEELLTLGIEEETLRSENYVKARGLVSDFEYFDADFFEYTPNEVNRMSPQLRLLYKGVWEALEDSGYYPGSTEEKMGVFIGGSDDFNWYHEMISNSSSYSDAYQAFTMSTNHFLATRLAYKFNIKGPAFSALTGCSTTLVTAHLACQSLQLGECDIAISGGITVELRNRGGYLYQEGLMFSPDGHCRPFDADAKGTVFSNGMGIVILKRLEDALAANDHIYAVIKGSAVNNDGSQKAGFTAPSVEGQKEVIREAYQRAGIDPETVSYVEAHGTGTILGDPIEVESLTEAFATDKKSYCMLGSVKGNVGHTDTAAGIVGLIKVALSLKNRFIPGTVNYQKPNPKISFDEVPFIVSNTGKPWINENHIPLRAGINSFGVGGTNAHMVLEEAPERKPGDAPDKTNLLLFSAKTEQALSNQIRVTIQSLASEKNLNISDAAWTLMNGRKHFKYRKAVVINEHFGNGLNIDEFLEDILDSGYTKAGEKKKIYFMFSGQGSQYQGMGRDLYNAADSYAGNQYRKHVDEIFHCLSREEQEEFYDIIYGNENPLLVNETKYSQFALFVTEYALFSVLADLGIRPDALIGHSIGEVTAAAVAGVWNLADAVKIVRARGDIMQKQQPGVMLAVMADTAKVETMLIDGVSIALNNTSDRCVVGGTSEKIKVFEQIVIEKGLKCSVIKTSHAFHTHMMQDAAAEFGEFLSRFEMKDPAIPIVSNITGQWAGDGQMNTAKYWSDHITHPVQFAQILEVVLKEEQSAFIEVGAGRSLCTFAIQHKDKKDTHAFINLIRHAREKEHDLEYLYAKLGNLWGTGIKIDWKQFMGKRLRNKISLPAYRFDKKRYPIKLLINKENGSTPAAGGQTAAVTRQAAASIERPHSLENQVIDAYQSVLGFEEITADQDFFELGGDSLKAISLVNVIESTMGIKVAVSEIFKRTTPKKLTLYIAESGYDAASQRRMKPIPQAPYYNVSSAQKRMFSLYQLDPINLAYNLPSATIIEGRLNEAKVREAVRKLSERHEVLRTSFAIKENKVVQIIADHVSADISFEQKAVDAGQDIKDLMDEFVRPFDLSIAPLWRLKLIAVNDEKSILLFDVHHIIADATSVEILKKDFNDLYISELAPLKLQYKDFVEWQNQYLQSEEAERAKSYWTGLFEDSIPILELPLDRERAMIKTFKGSRNYFTIGADLTGQLEQFAKQNGATMYMVLLSAWYVLLSRYSGQEDIVIGTPVAGRNTDEVSNMMGMFINMLAMRNRPEAAKRFIDFFREVKEQTLEALKFQDYQFDELIDHLEIRRDFNRNVLFDVCFDYQNMNVHDISIEGKRVSPFDYDPGTADYDLVLTCRQGKTKEIQCFIDYASDLFEKDSIQRLIDNYSTVIKSILTEYDSPIGQMNVISDSEKTLIHNQFKETELFTDKNILLHEMFEANVLKHPQKTAFINANGKEYSYRQLNDRVNTIAHKLISINVSEGDLVGILTKRDEWLLAGMLAILKTGAAYVPIDFNFPKERISYMIQQSNPKAILADPAYRDKLEYEGLCIDCASLAENEEIVKNPQVSCSANPLAYVMFTSGSTGNPKGVMVNHRAVTNFIYDILQRNIFADPKDRAISITTLSFDIFAFESIVPMCTGHSVYMANEEEQLDPALAASKIIKYDVTHILSTVSRIKVFIENKAFEPALKKLKCILSGGENYPIQMLREIQEKSTGRIYNMYGPTEATIWSTTKDLTTSDYISIGHPIANTQIFIVSKENRLQPYGVYGEICIAGEGLAQGYYNNEEETNKKFTFIEELPGTRIYKTGDRGRMKTNGEVEISGRLDNQVKVRGYRIELGEIEKAVLKHPWIAEAVVKVVEKADQNKDIALFYSLKEDAPVQPDGKWLRDWVEAKLPQYMVPAEYVPFERMPKLPNGKLNKSVLKVPEKGNQAGEAETVQMAALKSVDERAILNIWKEVLQKDTFGIHDNFFDAGGNSLALIMVNNKINNDLGITIPMIKLFEYPTVAGILQLINQQEGGSEHKINTDEFDDDQFGSNSDSESGFTISQSEPKTSARQQDIAVIGIACRFPDAGNTEEFWQNVVSGKECIKTFSDQELLDSGIDEALFVKENYVKAKGYLDEAEYFDAKLFGYSDKEARMMDPQIRLLHQCTYEVLEDAGYNSYEYGGRIGMFAGSSSNLIWMTQFINTQDDIMDGFEAITYNERDFLTTRIAYKLNLRGPSMNIQTACSTSLVAVHQAIESLHNGEADMAIAGGVCLSYPRKEGYLWHEGMIFSKDGHCRPFSDDATGTVPGEGCGVVLLKPLDKALADMDHVYAVIKGSAVNNDGFSKIGYTAPSVKGQCEVIKKALAKAKTVPEEICYLETHGTGTALGDPIEIESLKQAWSTDQKGYCALGAVKANLGHLDAAAGIAGFIKTVLVLHHKLIPPLININRPNDKLSLDDSPFYINTRVQVMEQGQGKLKAAVSSFGIGGTNAHIILEEAD